VHGETRRRLREEIASLWPTDPIRRRRRNRRRGARDDGAVRPDDLTTLPESPAQPEHRRSAGAPGWAAIETATAVTAGHLGSRDRRDHVPRGEAAAAGRSVLSASETDVPPSDALRRSLTRDVHRPRARQ
jgi:hypothetical protein